MKCDMSLAQDRFRPKKPQAENVSTLFNAILATFDNLDEADSYYKACDIISEKFALVKKVHSKEGLKQYFRDDAQTTCACINCDELYVIDAMSKSVVTMKYEDHDKYDFWVNQLWQYYDETKEDYLALGTPRRKKVDQILAVVSL